MKQYSINETYTASSEQQIFNIEKPFINDTISVFVNGSLKNLGEDKEYQGGQRHLNGRDCRNV